MNPSRTPRVRLFSGGAAGVLALAALAVTSPAAEAASVRAAAAPASAVVTTSAAPGAAKKAAKPSPKTLKVRTSKQLRRAVGTSNNRSGAYRIVLTDNVNLNPSTAGNGGAYKGDLDVLDTLVVEGRGHYINARRIDRIFDVPAGTRLVLKGITLKNGRPGVGESGGALRSAGTAILQNVTIVDSVARGTGASGGGAFNDGGTMTVSDSDIKRNKATRAGGGVEANGGRTTISSSNLANNSTGAEPGNGGAVHLTGKGNVLVEKTRVAKNSAGLEGGGLWNSAEGTMLVRGSVVSANTASGAAADDGGGGLYNDGGELHVVRTLVSKNTADGAAGSGGGILNDEGTLSVEKSTITNNSAVRAGGAIEANIGTTTVTDTEMSDNRAGATPGNGGALHLTGAGEVRVEGGSVTGNRAAAEGGGLWNSATGTMDVVRVLLRQNVGAGPDADNGGGGIYNDGGTLNVSGSTLDRNLANGVSGSGGGILSVGGPVDVWKTVFDQNAGMRAGGGIEVVEGALTVRQSTFDANTAGPNPGNGGAIHVSGAATTDVDAGQFTANIAEREGGALWNSATGTMTVTGSTLSGNRANGIAADDGGGAIFNNGGTLSVAGSTIEDNDATGTAGSGGGILSLGPLEVTGTTLQGNTAKRAGGAIELNGSVAPGFEATVSDSILAGNSAGAAPGNGGGLHVSSTVVSSISGTEVRGNSAAAEGGGLWNSGVGTMTVTDSEIVENTVAGAAADQGGGGLFQEAGDTGSLTVVSTFVHDNDATGAAGSGGGLLNDRGTVTVTDSRFVDNTAVRAGGGIEQNVGSTTLTGVDLDGNVAGSSPGNGGGMHVTGAGTTTYTGGAVSDNQAANQGGGLWCSNTGTFTATGLTFSGNSAGEGDDVYHQDPATPATMSLCSINGTTVAQGSGLPALP